MNLNSIQQQLRQSQAAFIAVLEQANEEALYRRTGDDWTLAEVLAHMCEARTFFAAAMTRLHADRGGKIGRDLTHDGRTGAIVEHGRDNSAEIKTNLITSHNAVMHSLSSMTDDDLATIRGDHPAWGNLSLGEFIARYFVAHDQAHVAQAQALLS